MLNFEFQLPTRMIYGKEKHKEIGQILKPLASKILLHYGSNSIKKSGVYDEIIASLEENDIKFVELGGVMPNPRLTKVYEGIELCKKENIELVLAVGGGSVIDSSKAIAMGAYYEGDIWEVFEQGKAIEKALPVVTILTIPASGSESSRGSLIRNEEKNKKLGYINSMLRPKISIINSELFFTLPKNQVANGVSDMMSHIFERYFTNTEHTDVVDGLCEATLKAIMKNGLIVYNDNCNLDAWFELGLGGTLAHNNMLGIGRQQDWACHDIEQELSGIYDLPHGAALAAITPSWMEYVYKDNINMFVQFAVNVMGVEGGYRDPEYIIKEGISRLRDFYNKLNLPSNLTELGVKNDSNLELVANMATGVGSLKKLDEKDVLEILKMAIGN